ncbi:MAG TPA: ABC transporter permease [Candidatus Udaeobacter sp.]|jgi:predicted permease|nr:ABC transporter permease [Candidatus Udaeobacter sp.]
MFSETFRWLRTKCSRLFRRGKAEAALDAEMHFHFDQLIAQFRGEGMTEREARLAAQREFGNTGRYREEIRDTWRPPQLADTWRTLQFAVRSLRRSPGFALLAIITLAVGIGGNTMMFSAFTSILKKPLPYPQQEMLERFNRVTPQDATGDFSTADFRDLQRAAANYGEVAAYVPSDCSLSESGRPAEMVPGIRCTSNLLNVLGVLPKLGRNFLPQEELPGNDRVVIISERCWQKRFGGRDDIIGRRLRVDGQLHEIVGVLPASFNDWRHLGWVDFFRPFGFDRDKMADRRETILRVIGRHSALLSRAQADAFIANFGAHLARDFPEVNAGSSWRAVLLESTTHGRSLPAMLRMCIGLSAFVLLIACSNLANFLLARTITRSREFAVRSALGASRGQLLRPLVAETLLLALAGVALAMLVARWGADWLSYRSIGENGEPVTFVFNWSVFAWALGAAFITATAFGMAPALFALRLNVNEALKSGGRGTTGDRGHRRFRQFLIVGQFALAMVLLAGAAVFIRGLDELNHRRAGWQSEHLITGTIALPAASYPNDEQVRSFHRLMLERLYAMPEVASASVSSFTPFFDWPDIRKYIVQGQALPKPGHEPTAAVNTVSSRYFQTVGTRILAGRSFDKRDTATSPKVIIISQDTALNLFGNESALGKRLAQTGSDPVEWAEIIGVAADVKSVLPAAPPVTFQVYEPMEQHPVRYDEIMVRTANSAQSGVVNDIRNVITGLDPDLPVHDLQPADSAIDRANYQIAILRDILTLFAMLGLGLASVGIYGVIARTMAQRTNEFAIRFALGARARDISRLVLASGVKLALLGSAIGLTGALGVTHILAAWNSGMHLSSTPTVLGTTVFLVGVALISCWLPARRAGRINPIDALRAE